MKRLTTILLFFLGSVANVMAGANAPTNYFAGYVNVNATNAGTVEAGLVTNVGYIAIPISTLTDLATNQASASTGDVRAVVYGFAQAFYIAYQASTNKTATEPSRAAGYLATTPSNIQETVIHQFKSVRTIGSATFP